MKAKRSVNLTGIPETTLWTRHNRAAFVRLGARVHLMTDGLSGSRSP